MHLGLDADNNASLILSGPPAVVRVVCIGRGGGSLKQGPMPESRVGVVVVRDRAPEEVDFGGT